MAMSVTRRRSRRFVAPALVFAALLAGARFVNVAKLEGTLKGDEAVYTAMALSIAYDGDLTYNHTELARFEQLRGQGPSGIFLKIKSSLSLQWTGGWPPVRIHRELVHETHGLAFAKAFIYPLFAA